MRAAPRVVCPAANSANGMSGRGEHQREGAPRAGSAHRREVAAHSAREVATDRQTQTDSTPGVAERAIQLHERLEHRLQPLGLDAYTAVGHVDQGLPVALLAPNDDATT